MVSAELHTAFASKKIANRGSYQDRKHGNHNILAAISDSFYQLGQYKMPCAYVKQKDWQIHTNHSLMPIVTLASSCTVIS
jgi:hypothetical protein